ncbi:MAG: hypothetical protein KH571_09230, partial [Staphylococcus aureus]|nr:hypothetical protein [Staphylococcus aureus]
MSLHFAILFWLALIFLVAATFILVLMKKTGKESKKESYLSFTVILYIFGFAILIYTFKIHYTLNLNILILLLS